MICFRVRIYKYPYIHSNICYYLHIYLSIYLYMRQRERERERERDRGMDPWLYWNHFMSGILFLKSWRSNIALILRIILATIPKCQSIHFGHSVLQNFLEFLSDFLWFPISSWTRMVLVCFHFYGIPTTMVYLMPKAILVEEQYW